MTIARDLMRRLALLGAVFLLMMSLSSLLAGAPAVALDNPAPSDVPDTKTVTCPPAGTSVESARRIDRDIEDIQSGLATDRVAMGDTIELSGPGLKEAAVCGGPGKPLVLYIEGSAIAGLQPDAIVGNAVRFKLVRTEAARAAWNRLLGRPQFSAVRYSVSAGFEDKGSFPSNATIHLLALPGFAFLLSVGEFLVLAALFGLLATRTNILRDGWVANGTDQKAQYSLSKTQAAWWFFVILAAYLLIGLVTGDFQNSLNGTALTLLAIGGGTAIGAAAIGTSKENSPQAQLDQTAAKAQNETKIQELVSLPSPEPQDKAKLAVAQQTQKILAGVSQNFLIDILGDANGVSFHRFQSLGWNLVLTVVFGVGVYRDLAMPDFDPTLLGLLGISSLTYLGLKTTEATIPDPVDP